MNRAELSIVFMITFVIVSFVYAFLASATTVLYRNKYPGDLSLIESEILNGKASIGKRVFCFFLSLYFSPMFPPIYIIAGFVTFIAYLLT